MTTQSQQQSGPEATPAAGGHDKVTEEAAAPSPKQPREIGGPKGPEPTRYGDWAFNGRCTDF
jgi:hypothetical protein